MKLCCVFFLIMALAHTVTADCDGVDLASCFATFAKNSLFNTRSKDQFCGDLQTVIHCVKRACDNHIPQSTVDRVMGLLRRSNFDCDTSALNGSNTVGGLPWFCLVGLAALLPAVLL
ncbi:uncharacterized protein LOC143291463 [Babylonia areolata]|uniref:uncharacterized protein LOC143291463 n=1 Tax=Babylonia areolata TaxID=304850 RepID=UPI003FD2F117